uniref:Transmembrane protein n=1 Tax=Anopheles atroparvus TaxID=41427 RepID=A0AAG5DFI0_ANOAO
MLDEDKLHLPLLLSGFAEMPSVIKLIFISFPPFFVRTDPPSPFSPWTFPKRQKRCHEEEGDGSNRRRRHNVRREAHRKGTLLSPRNIIALFTPRREENRELSLRVAASHFIVFFSFCVCVFVQK